MNSRNIQPIQIWSPDSGSITVDKLLLKDFHHYFFDGGNGIVSYTLQNSSTQMEYFNNNIEIPPATMQQWGASDDIIFEYVAETLGLILI